MSTQVFINLPVRDLEKSKAFYVALGHQVNPKFTDENAACIVISDTIYVMLLVQDYFKTFTSKTLCDTATHIQTLIALSTESRTQVDEVMSRAAAAGGREAGDPKDYGFMYQRSFADPDGHTWEIFYMNEAEFPQE